MMKKSFLQQSRPMLTVMLQCETPEVAIGRIRNANCLGADAYGLQVESLQPEYHNPETYKRIFEEMKGRPSYVTYYRSRANEGKSDEELAERLELTAARIAGRRSGYTGPKRRDPLRCDRGHVLSPSGPADRRSGSG